MRNYIISILILGNLCLSAQEASTVLHGNIKNHCNDTIRLSNHYNSFTTVTNEVGDFRFETNLKDPDFLTFKTPTFQTTVFLLTGDTLELHVDPESLSETIHFKGKRADLNNNLSTVSFGQTAPQFSLKDQEGNMVKLSDFKGKYVYIDVWNSACKPCYKEFERMDELIEKYHDRNIAFIGVSLDRGEDTWKRTIERKELKGIQLFGNGWKSDFANKYFIYFNPRFILIDQDQQILYLSASRPTGDIERIIADLPGL